MLAVSRLNVWFEGRGSRVHAVRDVSLQLHRGGSLGLIGESGCGKTTTALAILGLLPPNAAVRGQVLFDGEDVLERGEQSCRPHRWVDVAMVFQSAMNALNPVRTIGRQLTEVMEFHGIAAGKNARARTADLLARVGLRSGVASSYPHELSGGMRQRAAIALALSCRPKVLLADEPTTAIDVIAQAQVLELLRRLTIEDHVALLFISHDLAVVAQMCREAAVMYAGKIIESGPIGPLCEDPRHPYTRALLSATPDLEAADKEAIVSLRGSAPRLDRGFSACSFAPRCPRAFAKCQAAEPNLIDLGAGRQAACFLNELPVPAVSR